MFVVTNTGTTAVPLPGGNLEPGGSRTLDFSAVERLCLLSDADDPDYLLEAIEAGGADVQVPFTHTIHVAPLSD